jgi:branched-chain amino acid aminotransferase
MVANIHQLIQANPDGSGNIKIFIKSLNDGPLIRLLYFNPHQYPTAEQFQNGVSVILFNAIRQNPNAKVMDVLLRNETEKAKSEEDAYEVLLVDKNGNITEGSRSNVFFIKKDQLITPPVQNVLEGVTRKHIIKLCIENQIPVSEQIAHQQVLEEMEAVFITGTSRRVLPVSGIGNQAYNVSHPFIKKLQQLFENHVQQYIEHYKTRNALKL